MEPVSRLLCASDAMPGGLCSGMATDSVGPSRASTAPSAPATNEPILLAPATSQLAAGAKRWREFLVRSPLTSVDRRAPSGTGDTLELGALLAPFVNAAGGVPRRVGVASSAAAVGGRAYREVMPPVGAPPAPAMEATLPEGERVEWDSVRRPGGGRMRGGEGLVGDPSCELEMLEAPGCVGFGKPCCGPIAAR